MGRLWRWQELFYLHLGQVCGGVVFACPGNRVDSPAVLSANTEQRQRRPPIFGGAAQRIWRRHSVVEPSEAGNQLQIFHPVRRIGRDVPGYERFVSAGQLDPAGAFAHAIRRLQGTRHIQKDGWPY